MNQRPVCLLNDRRHRFLLRLLRVAGFALISQVVLLASGCSHLPPPGLKAPEVSISEIQITEIGSSQVKFSLNLSALNPNETALPLSNLAINLELMGRPFADGRARQDFFELPPGVASLVPIEFVLPTSRVRELLSNIRRGDTERLEYQLKGSANWGKDGVLLPFARQGELTALKRLLDLFKR